MSNKYQNKKNEILFLYLITCRTNNTNTDMNVNDFSKKEMFDVVAPCGDECSLCKWAYKINDAQYDYDDGKSVLSELSMGSIEEQQALEEEEISEEDARKIERWTKIREDGFEIINGVKYTETGSVIYSDYEREEEEEYSEYEGTPSQIDAKIRGDILRLEARKRIEENPEAYEGLPMDDDEQENFDWEAEDAIEVWNSQKLKERDIYYANGGLTNEEFSYLHRNIYR